MLPIIAARVLAKVKGMTGAKAGVAYSFDQVEARLNEILPAVEAAIAADDQQANSFWTRFSQLVEHNFNYFAERRRFEAAADNIKLSTRNTVNAIVPRIIEAIRPTAPVPDNLQQEAEDWEQKANHVQSVKQNAQQLRNIPGWEGDASTKYDMAVDVQVDALTELKQVMLQAAGSASYGADAHRALFLLTGSEAGKTANRIKSAPAGTGDQYYTRTAAARTYVLQLMATLIGEVLGQEALAKATELRAELDAAMAETGLTVNDWPTGT